MKNLVFDDGFKEFTLNGDKNKVIRFNPSDMSIIERFNKAEKTINEAYEKIESTEYGNTLEDTAKLIGDVNKLIKEQVDYIFDSEVSDMVFGNQSPLNLVNGVPFFERFINATKEHIEAEIISEQKKSQKRIEKYTKVYHK